MSHFLGVLTIVCTLLCGSVVAQVGISDDTMRAIGQRVWQNEGSGRIDRLTWWNKGEQFASLGIAHFIWYPDGPKGPFEESFPALLTFMRGQGVSLPPWLSEPDVSCPWSTRDDFLNASDSPEMLQLQELLTETVEHQSQFLVNRLNNQWPQIRAASQSPAVVDKRFHELMRTLTGQYALVDYINFKGDGTKRTERYAGQGWGLLQVLENMSADATDIHHRFADSAGHVLAQRVANSPPERNEQRWLKGWLRRVDTYRDDG